MFLISEINEDIKYVAEEKEGKKHFYLEGPNIVVEQKNRNGRMYLKHIVEPVVESFINDKIKTGTAYGELGHPEGPKLNEERFSHRITNFRWDGNNVIGKSVIIEEGRGKLILGMIETGGKIGMSTRGLGSVVEKNGVNEVQNDFKLITVDAVTDPSGPGCWVNGIMEGVSYFYDATSGTLMESRIDDLHKKMKKMTNKELQEKKLKLFEYYISGLSTSK